MTENEESIHKGPAKSRDRAYALTPEREHTCMEHLDVPRFLGLLTVILGAAKMGGLFINSVNCCVKNSLGGLHVIPVGLTLPFKPISYSISIEYSPFFTFLVSAACCDIMVVLISINRFQVFCFA